MDTFVFILDLINIPKCASSKSCSRFYFVRCPTVGYQGVDIERSSRICTTKVVNVRIEFDP